MRVDVCVIQLQWVKHQEVGRLKEWQLVLVTTEIVSMYLYEIYPVFQYLLFLMPKFQVHIWEKKNSNNICYIAAIAGKEAITYDLHSFNCYLYENLDLIIIFST